MFLWFTVSVVKNIKKYLEEGSISILKILHLNDNTEEYQKIYYIIYMPEENINQEFRMKKIDEIRNYLIEEIN